MGNVESWDGSSWTEVANVLDDSRSGQGAGDYNDMMLLNGSGATANNTQMWNGTAWVQRGSDIDGEAEGDYSGYSFSLSSDGTIVAIGAPYNHGSNGYYDGHVRVYNLVPDC